MTLKKAESEQMSTGGRDPQLLSNWTEAENKGSELSDVDPRFEEWTGAGELPTRYVIAKNLQRRQLTIGQRAAIAAECVPLLHEEARKRLATSSGGRDPRPLSNWT